MVAGSAPYREFQPPAALQGLVEVVWLFSSLDTDVHRITPDGRCELVVHLGVPFRELSGAASTVQSSCVFAGQLTRPLFLQAQGATTTLSARLAPGAAGSFLHASAAKATDRRLRLADIDPAAESAVAWIRQADSDHEIVTRFWQYLTARFRSSPQRLDERIVSTLADLEQENRPQIARLAQEQGLSSRQLERLFLHHVGVPASTYASIVRFRRIFDVLAEEQMTLAEAAAAVGYSDQPQMAREFQRFLGCSATRFLRERAQLAAAMTRGRGMSY